MPSITQLTLIWVVLPLGAGMGGSDAESPTAYELSIRASLTILPPQIQPWFRSRLGFSGSAATGADEAANWRHTSDQPPDARYLKMDIAGQSVDPVVAREAVRDFPTEPEQAKNLFTRCGERQGGYLPWAIREHFDALIRAFEHGEPETISLESRVLLELAADAALPFNTTFNRDGQASGNLILSKNTTKQALKAHRTVRNRCHEGLLVNLKGRLVYEMRLSPDRYRAVTDPVEEAFTAMRRGHEALPLLLEADHAIMGRLNVRTADEFLIQKYRYYTALSERVDWIMEARLEDAASLGANLLGTAWTLAGAPDLNALTIAAEPERETGPRPAEHESAPFVASKQSKVFHRATCPHARRISPANLMQFETLEEAVASGRKPCKTCQPDDPSALMDR
ncbi:MAG: hypothetical protein JSV78_11315 [Phycisphaerales bacterium]|nr:MAG: hypothetical protein JSV78_11315 [Phycisphaerales bacterium]